MLCFWRSVLQVLTLISKHVRYGNISSTYINFKSGSSSWRERERERERDEKVGINFYFECLNRNHIPHIFSRNKS
jgi:hypothetical protein